MAHHWRDSLSAWQRMQHFRTVETGLQICLSFAFLIRSCGVALSWISKDYWGLKEVPVRSFLVVGKTSVIFTVLTWCCPTIHEILLHDTSIQRHVTSDWGWPASSSVEDTARELWHVCVPFYRSVSVFFIAEFNFTESFFDLCLYMNCISRIQRYYEG